ncbi:melanocortin receptor 5-like [Oculina patagonica]
MTLLSTASFFGVMTLSVDRFLAIHLHLRYQELVTHKRVVAVVISMWVFSAFLSSYALRVPTNITYLVLAVVASACLLTSAVLYYKIYLAVRRHRIQIHTLEVQQVAQSGEMAANVASLYKSAVSTFYVYLVFLVCYSPQSCSLAFIILSGTNTVIKRFSIYAWTLLFLNSSLNPVVYCWKMRHIRHAIMDILRNILPTRKKEY